MLENKSLSLNLILYYSNLIPYYYQKWSKEKLDIEKLYNYNIDANIQCDLSNIVLWYVE
jgi:hypothetical protein